MWVDILTTEKVETVTFDYLLIECLNPNLLSRLLSNDFLLRVVFIIWQS